MARQFLIRALGCLVLVLGLLGCSGTPDVSTRIGPNLGAPSDDAGTGEGGDQNRPDPIIDTGDHGSAGESGGGCKKTCDSDECGPIADGCGDIINCGGCTAPQTCGGGGEPSHCGGKSACKPKSCADLGATCGEQPDGCGGSVDCWSHAAKANGKKCTGDGEQCVDGDCTVPGASCKKKTCSAYDADADGLCGPVSDGCGGTLDCDFDCASDEICGAVAPGVCGKASCQPLSCETALVGKPSGFCGFVPDGCGGEVKDCATACTGSDTCGGGGTPDECGHGSTQTCVPRTSGDCGSACGPISDGCGDTVECGGCTDPQTCGGGNVPGECGAPACQPRSCTAFGANCGTIPDGCGSDIPCGSCGTNAVCNANQCEAVVCTPRSSAEVCPGFCGQQSDGCGGLVDCGGCTGSNTCGGGGTESVCGSPPCTPLTCADVGASCGPIGDGCGGFVTSCGTCSVQGETCGGGGTPSVCGKTDNGNCTGLCQNQVSCPAGQETRLTGTVYAPNGTQPLYNALVYVPNAPLPAINAGPTCGRCEDEDLGEPIAAALTGADGAFVLKNVPAGVDFPLVVKMGKWRRVVTIPAQTQCTNVNLTVDQERLPRNMNDATAGNKAYLNIPQMAVVTGERDAMECVLRKIGVSDVEFVLPTATGRVHLYRANGAYAGCSKRNGNGTCQTKTSSALSNLFSNTNVNKYDLTIFDCEGSANEHNSYDPKLRAFAEAGGRVFASHFSYTYLHDNGNFASTATWGGPQQGSSNLTTGIVDTGTSKGQAFNAWLGYTSSYSTTYGNGYIDIQDPRYYAKANNATNSERFVYTDDNVKVGNTSINELDATQEYAFNTPVGASADNICGRVLYSAFHVAVGNSTQNAIFPEHCSTGPLTAQEKVLEFMLFDLSACVSVGQPGLPMCTAKTCNDLSATCGYRADGCGGLLDCGQCGAPDTCGGGGTPNQCGHSCTQTTCGAKGANCGNIADGCGGTLDCGNCTSPAICGGGGTANVCGTPACTPRSCGSVGANCGPISDGCGGTVNCGTCSGGNTCGGGGSPNVCGMGSCNPKTCQGEGAECGFIGDGCGGTVACGVCDAGQTCGAGGPNLCGGGCVPRQCSDVNAECGFVGDGCGGVLSCGTCTPPKVCGGGGTPSRCGGSCVPRTCTSAGAACGAISDGCGGVLSCGACPAGKTCGAGGTPNQCGNGTCSPKSCSQANAECGAVGDGCGNIVLCGTCPSGKSCGGGGTPNQCGAGGCIPLSCDDQGAECGPAADGCGGLLDCGTCSSGTCGGGGASKCGSIK